MQHDNPGNLVDEGRRKADLVHKVSNARQVWAAIEHEDGSWETVMYRPTPAAFGYILLHLHQTLAAISEEHDGEEESSRKAHGG